MHAHGLRDRAVRAALGGYAYARQLTGHRDARNTAAHLLLVDPAELRRFAQLGVPACVQLPWATRDIRNRAALLPCTEPGRHRWMYPARSLEKAGARLTGSAPRAGELDGEFEGCAGTRRCAWGRRQRAGRTDAPGRRPCDARGRLGGGAGDFGGRGRTRTLAARRRQGPAPSCGRRGGRSRPAQDRDPSGRLRAHRTRSGPTMGVERKLTAGYTRPPHPARAESHI